MRKTETGAVYRFSTILHDLGGAALLVWLVLGTWLLLMLPIAATLHFVLFMGAIYLPTVVVLAALINWISGGEWR